MSPLLYETVLTGVQRGEAVSVAYVSGAVRSEGGRGESAIGWGRRLEGTRAKLPLRRAGIGY